MRFRLFLLVFLIFGFGHMALAEEAAPKTLAEISARLGKEASEAYAASPFSALSKDYCNRFSRNPSARAEPNETQIEEGWSILVSDLANTLTERMANHLADFLNQRMGIKLVVEKRAESLLMQPDPGAKRAIVLLDSGGGDPAVPESYSIDIGPVSAVVAGADVAGLRDGVVHLVDMIGFREAPILSNGKQTFRPRLPVRLGAVPTMGTMKDLVFLGYNAIFAGGGSIYALSTSDALPELANRRQAGVLEAGVKTAQEARRYGLKTYAFLDSRQKFPKDDPIFAAHPEIRGALTWKADGEYVLCTEHPLVRRYLCESIEGIFRADPELNGIVIIIGGEGTYHCFMRPYGVQKGHTNCERCEKLGAETVVANFCNALAEAARKVNPKAEVVIWPYSAEHVWSADKDQAGLIQRLNPGVALLTEIEKDEYVEKEGGVRKHLWDYSIDMIGPGERAKHQIAECATRGISVYLKSEPELGFEAPRLPHIPCMDRWADRAEALASCGATGAWVFPAFRACYGTSAAEIAKHFWWTPTLPKEEIIGKLAARIAGKEAEPHLREAWRRVSESIEYSPEIPPYYTGPYYLGPAHPMCADPDAALPQVFYGYYLFMAEMTDSEGAKKRPTFITKPSGNPPVFLKLYRKMELALKQASDEMNAARPLVDKRHMLTFDDEDSPTQWFYRTARTEANFYESCILRDSLLKLAAKESRSEDEIHDARRGFERWLIVLKDEKANAEAALPIMDRDSRLDFRYGGDHTFEHGTDMLQAKLELISKEIAEFVPSIAKRCGVDLSRPANDAAK